VNVSRRGFFAAHPHLKRGIRAAYFRLNRVSDHGADERMDPAVRERLDSFYAPHNERLATVLADAGIVDGPEWLFGRPRIPSEYPSADSAVASEPS
jgi:hypothetical protein